MEMWELHTSVCIDQFDLDARKYNHFDKDQLIVSNNNNN